MVAMLACLGAHAQVNSGSNGSDGAFNPTTNTVINMADHPTGIYHYTSVNITNPVMVTFTPNANNTPVVWLVQSNCVISGTVDVSGQSTSATNSLVGGGGGPGGWAGGNGGNNPSSGYGPGGGAPDSCASYANAGATFSDYWGVVFSPGPTYGNSFLLPLLGGSGGGGMLAHFGGFSAVGGGGGGAILIATPNQIILNGSIMAKGGAGIYWANGESSGCGSGGGVRLVSQRITGAGTIDVSGGFINVGSQIYPNTYGGSGRVRLDVFQNSFSGSINGVVTQGFQPIIIQTNGQGAQLTLTSVGGVPVSASPSGQLATPDAVLSAQQNNPIPIVVHCSNIPLNTQITVSVKPANGATVSATGFNNTGTLASSTATVPLTMPHGGGIIYATAATGN